MLATEVVTIPFSQENKPFRILSPRYLTNLSVSALILAFCSSVLFPEMKSLHKTNGHSEPESQKSLDKASISGIVLGLCTSSLTSSLFHALATS